MGFDWNTDDETIWEEQAEAPAGAQSGRPWVPWLKGLLVLLLVAGAAYAIYRQVSRRVDAAVEAMEEEVRSSYALAQRAARTKDRELLVPLLSGRDAAWTEAQKALLETSLLFDRAPGPFGLVPQDGDPVVLDVTFSPELDEAELLVAQKYAVAGRAGMTATLQQSLVYRRGADRWLYSPPTAEFWGERETTVHDRLLLTFPGRDAEVARRLAQDLDEWLAALCGLSGVNCPARWKMDVTLTTDPISLVALADPLNMVRGGQGVALPTPSLIGLPVGDDAYRALAQGYGARVLASALSDGIRWECCEHVLFYRPLLERQLQAMGVWSGARDPAGVVANVDHLLDLERAGDLWQQADDDLTPADDLLATTFVEFVLAHAEADTTPLALMMLLQDRGSLSNWVAKATGFGSVRDEALREAWRAFVEAKVEEAQEVRAAPSLPDQDLWLACGDDRQQGLYRYHLAADTWEEIEVYEYDFFEDDFLWLVPLAQGRGLIVAGMTTDGSEGPMRMETVLWRDGEQLLLATATEEEGDLYIPLRPADDPAGQYTVAIHVSPDDEFGLELLDLASCGPAGCEWIDVPGLPKWSPDGSGVIALDPEDNRLFLGDATLAEWTPLTSRSTMFVMAAFWLGNDTIGTVVGGPQAGVRVAPATGDGPPRTVVTDDALLAALGEETSSRLLSVRFAQPAADGQELVIFADDFGPHTRTFAFAARPGADSWAEATPETVRVDYLFDVSGYMEDLAYLLPQPVSGGWLTFSGAGDQGQFLLYDLEARKVVLEASATDNFWPQGYGWSADGRWLARPGDGYLDLMAPAGMDGTGLYRHLIFHDFETCMSVAWVNK